MAKAQVCCVRICSLKVQIQVLVSAKINAGVPCRPCSRVVRRSTALQEPQMAPTCSLGVGSLPKACAAMSKRQ